MDFSQILKEIITVNDAQLLSSQIESLINSQFETKNLKERLKKIDNRFYEVISDNLIGKNNEIFFGELLEKIKKLKKVKISLFFLPTRALLEKFSKKLEEDIGQKVLIEIEENYSGHNLKIAFFWEGKYGEF